MKHDALTIAATVVVVFALGWLIFATGLIDDILVGLVWAFVGGGFGC